MNETPRKETLWALTRGERLRYGAAIAAIAASSALLFAVPLVVQAAFDGVLAPPEERPDGGPAALLARHAARLAEGLGSERALWLAAAASVFLTALAGLAQHLQARWAARSSEGIARRLRVTLEAHLARLPRAWLDRADSGDVVQRCTSDVETLRAFLATQVVEIGRGALPLAIALPLLLWLDARMTLVALALFPLVLAMSVLFFRRVQALFQAMDEAEASMTTLIQENLTGIRVVRAFGREAHELERFRPRVEEYRDRTERMIRAMAVFWPSVDLLALSQIGLVIFVAAARVRAGTLSVGELFAFATYASLLVMPLRVLGRVLSEAGKATVSMRRLAEILELPLEEEGEGAPLARPVRGAISARGLVFGFEPGRNVLRGLDLELAAGETVALLGPPGAGKSTLVQLLLRLYDHELGELRLDGRELRELPRAELRRHVAACLQEPFLYSRTIAENLRVGRPDATQAELERAARDACVHESILGFAEGYDTRLGERGVTLSGGQRQRVAIARALLAEPDVLLLDDALSAVDTRTEAAILDALRERRGGRTTLIVTHRLSSAVRADRVVVLERGRVVQQGTHAELTRVEGPYARLWRIQGALEAELETELAATSAEEERT